MKLKPEDQKVASNAWYLVKWEDTLAEIYSLIHNGNRDDKIITHLETILIAFVEDRLQVGGSITPAELEASPLEQLFKLRWGQDRRRWFKYLIGRFGEATISSIFEMMLSVRAANSFRARRMLMPDTRIISIRAVSTLTPKQIMRSRNMGKKSTDEVQALLEKFSLSLSMVQSEITDCFDS